MLRNPRRQWDGCTAFAIRNVASYPATTAVRNVWPLSAFAFGHGQGGRDDRGADVGDGVAVGVVQLEHV